MAGATRHYRLTQVRQGAATIADEVIGSFAMQCVRPDVALTDETSARPNVDCQG